MIVSFSRRDGYSYESSEPHAGEDVILEFNVTGEEAWYDYVEYFNRFLCACGYIPRRHNAFVEEITSDES